MTRRRFWLLTHRVNGLLLAGFLTVVGISGTVLCWRLPLERLFAPQLFPPVSGVPLTQRADPVAVREQVERAFPWARVDTLDLSAAPEGALQFTLIPRDGSGSESFYDEAFADPVTGKVLGWRRYGDLRQGAKNIIPFVYLLHQELALGHFGTLCLGAVALLWTFDCFVGMYLSFPARGREAGPLGWRRSLRWITRFAPSFQIRWAQGGFRRLYDVHRASGVWFWLLLLVFSWTGVAFNLPVIYAPVMRVFGSSASAATAVHSCSNIESQGDWRKVLQEGRALMAEQAERRHFHIIAERSLSYAPGCEATYRVRSSLDVDRIGNTQLVWTPSHTETFVFTAPTGTNAADTVTTWLEAIHEAQIGGNLLRLMDSLAGIITAALSVTGVWIFARKMRG